MSRTKAGLTTKKRHKTLLERGSGFCGSHSRLFKIAQQELMKASKYSYEDRKNKKTIERENWIRRINAKIKYYTKGEFNYSKLMHKLKERNIGLNRKMIAELVNFDPKTFLCLVTLVTEVNIQEEKI